MIDFYTNSICIILIIIISILFSKIMLSNNYIKEDFNDLSLERVDADGHTPAFFERIKKDKEIMNIMKNIYLESYFPTAAVEVEDNITQLNADDLRKNIKNLKTELPKIYSDVLSKYEDLNNKYVLKKKRIEKRMVDDLAKFQDTDEFNVKNIKLKKVKSIY